MRRIFLGLIIGLSLIYIGCKVTIFTFDAPSTANTGTIVPITISGEVFNDDDGTREHGIILQIPQDWQVISAEAVDKNNISYSFTTNSTYAELYVAESGHKIWVGTNYYSSISSSTKNLTATIRVLTGNFSGNTGDLKDYTIKAAAGVYRSSQWVTDDPKDQYNFSNITQDKYVETISLKKVIDTTAPSPITSDQIQFTYCDCSNTISLDWTSYNEEAEEDVVGYNIYHCTDSPYSGSPNCSIFNSVTTGIQTTNFLHAMEGIGYLFAVTSFDEAGNESSSSFTASYTPQKNIWDVKGDGKIGLEEAIHALQIVSGMRNQ